MKWYSQHTKHPHHDVFPSERIFRGKYCRPGLDFINWDFIGFEKYAMMLKGNIIL